MIGAWPDATPRNLRVSFRDAEGDLVRFAGRWTRRGDRLRGMSLSDDGATLHACIVDASDVVQVDREDPVYGGWVTAP